MHQEIDHSVGVISGAQLYLLALFARAWNGAVGVSICSKPPIHESRIDTGAGIKSCLN
jgi:hypothetical protein